MSKVLPIQLVTVSGASLEMRPGSVNKPVRLSLKGSIIKALFSKGQSSLLLGCLILCLLLFQQPRSYAQDAGRTARLLDQGWVSTIDSTNPHAYLGFQSITYTPVHWKKVTVPHNWDDYGGYRRLKHGNLHGYAWYRKTFVVKATSKQRIFLWFEGVGSYATVWVNGKKAGYHAGGRTSFTLDITDLVHKNKEENILAVRADHPAGIRDLPWVCGGCSDETGFSEGSQPMGIFRPVHLLVTGDVHVVPFGVHIWNDTTVRSSAATLYIETTIKSNRYQPASVELINKLLDKTGTVVATLQTTEHLEPGQIKIIPQSFKNLSGVHLWSLEHPYLYHLETTIKQLTGAPDAYAGGNLDKIITPYGIRWIRWPSNRADTAVPHVFYLNGKAVFINGIAGYEHALGQSHAFTSQEIQSRVEMIRATGFNAFRDAHQPHNLRFQKYWDSLGVLWWPQFSAHIWFDTPAFRASFIHLLRDWVIERRNSPSLILWGLQNESTLPADFAKACVAVIRELDPTASSQRMITTCNGGEGTDWDVPQNWTGTYGGDPATYARDLKKQVLVGEYGGWRTIDLHTEGKFRTDGPLSENRWCQLLEQKIRLAATVKDSVCGQFFWLLSSHDNPGRVQAAEGLRVLDQIGPVNYKGLLTSWEEPTDGFYLYRANFVSGKTSPMVYILSHTWPDRWNGPGIKNDLEVYSNCDSVALFNDINAAPLGVKLQQGIGTHFRWDNVTIRYNVLYAVGYVGGKAVATDMLLLHHLPIAPQYQQLFLSGKNSNKDVLKPTAGVNYIYRVNCGGPRYVDHFENTWLADRQQTKPNTWGSSSWTADYPGMPAYFASQRRIFDPIAGTQDPALFQTFRYGREKLQYTFPVPNGDYQVELYFTEPWWGVGGGMDCMGWRLFDVSINGKIVLDHFDIWKASGKRPHVGIKKTFTVHATQGQIRISFPHTYSGQAIIAAIAIAADNKAVHAAPAPDAIVGILQAQKIHGKDRRATPAHTYQIRDWMDTGDSLLLAASGGRQVTLSALPPDLYGAQWIVVSGTSNEDRNAKKYVNESNYIKKIDLLTHQDAYIYIALNTDSTQRKPAWLTGFTDTKTQIETDQNGGTALEVYRMQCKKAATILVGNDPLFKGPYLILWQPVTTLQPAYDQLPETTYGTTLATHSGGIASAVFNDKTCLGFTADNGGSQWIEWPFVPGVANFYALKLKYANNSDEIQHADIALIAADGTVMQTDSIALKPTKKGKWNSFDTQTKSMINAGHYKLRVVFASASKNIFINSFQFR